MNSKTVVEKGVKWDCLDILLVDGSSSANLFHGKAITAQILSRLAFFAQQISALFEKSLPKEDLGHLMRMTARHCYPNVNKVDGVEVWFADSLEDLSLMSNVLGCDIGTSAVYSNKPKQAPTRLLI